MKKRILALWVSDYSSSGSEERFLRPFNRIGYEVDQVDIGIPGREKKIIEFLNSNEYEYVFHVPYRNQVRFELLNHISDFYGVKTIAWNGDDEWIIGSDPDYFRKIALSHDFNITTWEPAVGEYYNLETNIYLGQWGYSESDWKYKEVEKDIDVYFCGGRTKERDIYLRAMFDAGIAADVDGPEYNFHMDKSMGNRVGRLSLKEMVNRYRRAKIGINFTSGNKEGYKYSQVKARNFEIPAVGTFQLTEFSPDLERYFNNDDLDTFKSPEELIRKIKYWLKDDGRRHKISMSGHEKNKNYTYEKILSGAFETIGELINV